MKFKAKLFAIVFVLGITFGGCALVQTDPVGVGLYASATVVDNVIDRVNVEVLPCIGEAEGKCYMTEDEFISIMDKLAAYEAVFDAVKVGKAGDLKAAEDALIKLVEEILKRVNDRKLREGVEI